MKLTLSATKLKESIGLLNKFGEDYVETYTKEIVDGGNEISKRAKEILQERATAGYWTGTLQKAITSDPYQREGSTIGEAVTMGVIIRVDRRKMPSPSYDEWVEIGHYKVAGDYGESRGDWWEGYHFMEDAYAETAPGIIRNVAKQLKITLNNFDVGKSSFVHKDTSRYVTGKKGFNVT